MSSESSSISVDLLSKPDSLVSSVTAGVAALDLFEKKVLGVSKAFEALDKSVKATGLSDTVRALAVQMSSVGTNFSKSLAGVAGNTAGINTAAVAIQRVNGQLTAMHRLRTNLLSVPQDVAFTASLRSQGQAATTLGRALAEARKEKAALSTTRVSSSGAASASVGEDGSLGALGLAGMLRGGAGGLLMRALPTGAMLGGAAALGKAAADFEQAMAAVAAVGEIDRNSSEFASLISAAQSGPMNFNATEKAGGLRELVAAGMTAKQATDSLTDTLNLAVAGEMNVARAAEIMVASMTAFKIEAKDSARVIDTLTAAANASPASIDDMGEAMKYVAPVGQALKISIEDVSAALAILANSGIRGGNAGRGLGSVLARLIAPSEDAKKALDAVGKSAQDLNPVENSLGKVLRTMRELDQETLVKLFGAEGLDISNTLASNAEAFDKMADKMRGAAGAGERFAAVIEDTAIGKVKALKNAITDTAAEFGSFLAELAKPVAVSATEGLGYVLDGIREVKDQLAGDRALGDFSGAADIAKSAIQSAQSPEEFAAAVKKAEQSAAGLATRLSQAIEGSSTFFGNSREELEKMAKGIQDLQAVLLESDAVFSAAQSAREQRIEQEITRQRAMEALQAFGTAAVNFGMDVSRPFRPIEIQGPAASDKQLAEADKITAALEERRTAYKTSLEIAEAEAAGNHDLADALTRQVRLLEEKKRIAETLLLSDEEAASLAERMVKATETAARDTNNAVTVADSLQSVGGGGNYFAPVKDTTQKEQLSALQYISRLIKQTNDYLSRGQQNPLAVTFS